MDGGIDFLSCTDHGILPCKFDKWDIEDQNLPPSRDVAAITIRVAQFEPVKANTFSTDVSEWVHNVSRPQHVCCAPRDDLAGQRHRFSNAHDFWRSCIGRHRHRDNHIQFVEPDASMLIFHDDREIACGFWCEFEGRERPCEPFATKPKSQDNGFRFQIFLTQFNFNGVSCTQHRVDRQVDFRQGPKRDLNRILNQARAHARREVVHVAPWFRLLDHPSVRDARATPNPIVARLEQEGRSNADI